MRRTITEVDSICSTVKSRESAVARIAKLAAANGATIDLHEFNGPREIGLDIVFGPYHCMIHLDGSERIGAFLGHWYVSTKSDVTFPVTFGADISGTINIYHYSKATTCEETWTGFLRSLESGLQSLAIEMAEEPA